MATNSLTPLLSKGGSLCPFVLNVDRFCNCFDPKNMAKVILCRFLGPGLKKLVAFTSFLEVKYSFLKPWSPATWWKHLFPFWKAGKALKDLDATKRGRGDQLSPAFQPPSPKHQKWGLSHLEAWKPPADPSQCHEELKNCPADPCAINSKI